MTLMGKAGKDSSVYNAHSTRIAATTKALAHGLSTAQIVQRAKWSNASAFHKYCSRQVLDRPLTDFQDTIALKSQLPCH